MVIRLLLLTLSLLTILAGLGVGNLAQTRIRNLADQPLAVLGGRVDALAGVNQIGAFIHRNGGAKPPPLQ